MKKYNLNIAGYNISFESFDSGPDLIPSQRFRRYISSDSCFDVLITVHSDYFEMTADAVKVFHAPLIEEKEKIMVKTIDNFWSIFKNRSDLYIKTIFPHSDSGKEATLKFSLKSREWDLYIKGAENETDPFEYPLDGLILYYLTVIHGDILIHASGVNHSGYGYLFSGLSGKGKSTMARLWYNAGSKVIHDDRLIIRNISGSFRMFSTPVYNDDASSESPLNKIFLIEHGIDNKIIPIKGATAVSLVMANCIQHNWDKEIIAQLIGSISMMCNNIPVFKLFFRPDRSITDFIPDYD